MPKHKPKRHLPTIDMTAMVDVAFLLLTFFILTTKFRDEERQKVDLPFSTGNIAIKQDSTMLITVDTTEQVFIGFGSPATRIAVLDKIASHYQLQGITEEGRHHFSLLATFGVPIQQLPAWLGKNRTDEQMKNFAQNGIPMGEQAGTNNDLAAWIAAARTVNIDMKFAIKGDDDVPMPTMEKIIHSLQEKKANKFYLITNLQGGGQADEEKAKGGEAAAGETPKTP